MARKIFAVTLSILLSDILGLTQAWASPYTADQMRVAMVRGNVEVCDKAKVCAPAEVGRLLKEGEIVKTGAGSVASLQYGSKDKFEVRERSRVMVDQITNRGSRFQIFVGAFKAKVGGGLFKRRDVSFITPVGVMAVRGTELLINTAQGGNTRVDVLFGRVDLIDPNTGKTIDNFIQGESGSMRASAQRNDGDDSSGNQNGQGQGSGNQNQGSGQQQGDGQDDSQDGNQDGEGSDGQASGDGDQSGSGDQSASSDQGNDGGGDDQGGGSDGVQFQGVGELDKGDISAESFAEAFGGVEGFESYSESREQSAQKADDFASNEASAVNDIVTTVQEDSIESGRVLRDRFGNIAQVQQLLLRPEGDQIQFVNLVKRDQYTYAGFFTPATLQSGSRYDYLETTITFNLSLPESLADWPSFFTDNSDTIKVSNMRTEMTNAVTGSSKRDYIIFEAKYNAATDELGGTTCTGSAVLGSSCFDETIIGFVDGSDSGKWRVSDCTSATCSETEQTTDGESSGDLYATAETPLNVELEYADTLNLISAASGSAELWMLFEGYGIDTDGNLLNIDTIESSSISDPFAFLKSVAGQVVISARYGSYDKTTNTGGTDLFRRGNIDLVLIPDLMVDLVQKYAASLADGI